MILWIRFLISVLRGMIKGPVDVMAPYTTSFRSVPFWDSELRYLNAARYFSFCELCVNEADVRNGWFFQAFLKGGIVGAVCNKTAHFSRPVKNWKKFQVTTDLLGWDKRFIYRRFRITQDGKVCFVALYKFATLGKSRPTPQDGLAKMGYPDLQSPPLPEEIKYLGFRLKKSG